MTEPVTRWIPVTTSFLAALALYLKPEERYISHDPPGLTLWVEDEKRLVFYDELEPEKK